MPDTLSTPEVETETNTGDEDRFSHIVTTENYMQGYVNGKMVTALCGKKWVPSKDPDKYPVCPKCKDVMNRIRSTQEGNN